MTATNLANTVGATTPASYTIDITKLSGDDLEMEYVLEQSTTQQGATNVLELDGIYVFVRQ